MEWLKSQGLLKRAENMFVKIDFLYEAYTKWCEALEEEPVDQTRFTKRLKQLSYPVVKKQRYSYLKNYTFDKEQAISQMISKSTETSK
jgi:phage/plasmid-associated DNA primase